MGGGTDLIMLQGKKFLYSVPMISVQSLRFKKRQNFVPKIQNIRVSLLGSPWENRCHTFILLHKGFLSLIVPDHEKLGSQCRLTKAHN